MSHRSRRYHQGRQGTATREDRCSHSRSHDESDRELEGTVRTREDGCGHHCSHDELNHELVGERSEDDTVTAVVEELPEGELSTQDLMRWMTLENAKRDEKMERCLQTLGASAKKEPRIAKWEEDQCHEKFFALFEAVMNDYRIDESQWMKHIKPSLTERLLTEWEAMPRQYKRNYDKFQQLIITRVGTVKQRAGTNGALFNRKTRNR